MRKLSFALCALLLAAPAHAQVITQFGPQAFGCTPGTTVDGNVTQFGCSADLYASASSCYSFDDPADLGNDDCTDTHDLTPVATPTATGGATGYAAKFTAASTNYANIADNDSLSGDNASDIAVCAWSVKGANNTAIASKYITAGAKEWYFYYVGGAVAFAISVDGSNFANQDTGAAHSTGERSLLCGWHDVSATTIYATENDDAFDSGTTQSGAIDNTSAQFVVGAEGTPGSYSNNVIGPVMYWKGDLGDFTTVRDSVYNSTKGKACADLTAGEQVNLISCWDMTEDGGPYADTIGSNTLTGQNTPTQAAGLVELSTSGMGAGGTTATTYYTIASGRSVAANQTYSFWMKSDNTAPTAQRMLVDAGTYIDVNWQEDLAATNFNVDALVYDGVGYDTKATGYFTNHGWTMITVVITGLTDGSLDVWINDTKYAGSFTGTRSEDVTKLDLGKDPDAATSSFDNFTRWDVALTQTQIEDLYAAGIGDFIP